MTLFARALTYFALDIAFVSYFLQEEEGSVEELASAIREVTLEIEEDFQAAFQLLLPKYLEKYDDDGLAEMKLQHLQSSMSHSEKTSVVAIATVVRLGRDEEALRAALKSINEGETPETKANPVVAARPSTLEPKTGDERPPKEIEASETSANSVVDSLSYSGSDSGSKTTADGVVDDKTVTLPRQAMDKLLLAKEGNLEKTAFSESRGHASDQPRNQNVLDDAGVEEEEEEKDTDTNAISLLGGLTRDGGVTESSSAGFSGKD